MGGGSEFHQTFDDVTALKDLLDSPIKQFDKLGHIRVFYLEPVEYHLQLLINLSKCINRRHFGILIR